MNKQSELAESNRRDFLKNASLATMMAVVGGVELRADDKAKSGDSQLTKIPPHPPINVGVIGLGERGREILTTLATLQSAQPDTHVVAICDTFPAAFRRAGKEAPAAKNTKITPNCWPTRMSRR
jgi:hypothetical protein